MHFLDKILSEWDEEEYSQHTSEQGGKGHLPEADLQVEYIDCRQGEDSPSHNGSRAGSYGLDNHVLSQRPLLLQQAGKPDCYDSDRDGGLEDLSDLEPEIGSCRREDYCHQYAQQHRIDGRLLWTASRRQERLVLFALLEFPSGILRKLVVFVFHL